MSNSKLEGLKNITITLAVSSVFITGGIGGYKILSELKTLKRDNEILTENFSRVNKKIILEATLSKKMPTLSVDEVISTSDRIYDLCQLYKMPISLVCGLIEVESQWNPKATSNVNAKGLMQVMSATAKPYLRADHLDYESNILYDPVTNVTVGIEYLNDLHTEHIENGYPDTNYIFSLHSFFWGTSNTYALYGKKDLRVNVPNFSYPSRVLEASKQYQQLGL